MDRKFQFLFDKVKEEEENDLIYLKINDFKVECIKNYLLQVSPVAVEYFIDNPNAKEIEIDIKEKVAEDTEKNIRLLFQNQSIYINSQNDLFFKELSQKLQIQSLEDISENWEIYELQEAEEAVFSVDERYLLIFYKTQKNDEDDFDEENQKIKNLFEKLVKVGQETFCRLVINACIARWKLIHVFLKLIHFMSIEKVFCRILLHQMDMFDGIFSIREEKSQTICYLARYFYDKGFIKAKKIISIFQQTLPFFFADLSQHPYFSIEENHLSFKKLVAEGVNPDPILSILRKDDVDTFQSIACMPNFNINVFIKPSDFEKCDFINNKECTYIEFCAFVGSIKCFKYIYLNEESKKSDNLIKYAIAGGNVEIVHICEQIGPISFKETREIAVKFHRWEIFEWLFEHKFNNQMNGDDDIFSFLFQSIQFSNFTTLSYVLYNDADYNYALPFTVEHDNVLLVKWLIKHKEKLFKEESTKSAIKNLLHYACRNENVDMLKLLLSQKEYNNVNSKYDGKTPIFIAIEKENFDLYKTLINNKKTKINIRDFNGKQVIHLACEYKNTEILDDLLKNKINMIDINSCDKTNNTPLHLACGKGNLKIIQIMFKYFKNNIILNIKNKQNKTPLMMACLSERANKRLLIIQFIYEHINKENKEKYINEQGPMKKTILHLACEHKEYEIVRFLSSLPEININSVDDDNRTALMTSIFYGFNDIIKILINHPKIDVKIKDKSKQTAYDIAINRSLDEELIKLIKEKNYQ